ncbi:E3 ubiquitin-protein ligase E3D isoform X1 [Acipenser ruthenus]|uniref:E3 ubiquitin-protein ligase E3D isoform X1 n=2 Tax=Acipenser ruthenus TaxID=7906 RepID=UPI00145A7AF2|nr:E3 ubiquitin-protein ligase E3D isoform X1 [Acipenser ruthenus]
MDDSDTTQAEVFIELRKRLQSGRLVLSSGFAEDPSEVDISTGSSYVRIKGAKSCCNIDLPKGVSITPPSCREMQRVSGDGLHIRLQLQNDNDMEVLPTLIESLKAQKSYLFACQSCRETILMERVFRRVLPLPNGNWNALVDDWCCHPDPFANRKLLPRKDDCLLGDTFVLVNWGSGPNEALILEPETADTDVSKENGSKDLMQKPNKNVRVICKCCRAMLGEVISSDTLKLYITEVTVKSPIEDSENTNLLNRSLFVENVIACRIVEVSSSQSTFRFLVQGHDGKAYILLWLLNADTLLVSSKTSVSGSAFIPSEDISYNEHKSYCASNVVKVLYLPCVTSNHKDIVDAWEKDIGVHSLPLPVTTCQELLLLLSASTGSLPPSMRTMNTFQVAFMKLASN